MPPKPKRPNTDDSQFLFVNEDANTVLRGTKDTELDRTKQSHVQRHNFARRKRMRDQAGLRDTFLTDDLRGTPTLASPHLDPGLFSPEIRETNFSDLLNSAESFATSGSIGRSSDLQQDRRPETQRNSSTRSSSAEFFLDSSNLYSVFESAIAGSSQDISPQAIDQGSVEQSNATPQAPKITNDFLGTRVNPLSNTQLALELFAPKLIQYYTSVIAPAIFTLDRRAVPFQDCRHASAVHADMQACFQEPAHLYALLASTSARMLIMDGRLFLPIVTEEDYHRVPIFFKTKAIEALRRKLAHDELDHQVIVDVFRLKAAASYAEDRAAEEAHSQALVKMIERIGGIDTFDDYTKEKIFGCDLNWSASTLTPPRLPLTYDPGDLPRHIRDEIMPPAGQVRNLSGELLLNTTDSDLFHPAMLTVIAELAELVRFYNHRREAGSYVHEEYAWMTNRRAAIEHRLLSFPRVDFREQELQQDCMRIVLIFWVGMNLNDPARKIAAAQQSAALQATLEETDLTNLWAARTHLLLWIATVGALAADDKSGHGFFTMLAARAARKLNITAFEQLEELLQGFFYLAETQQDAAAALFSRFEGILPRAELEEPAALTIRASKRKMKGKAKE